VPAEDNPEVPVTEVRAEVLPEEQAGERVQVRVREQAEKQPLQLPEHRDNYKRRRPGSVNRNTYKKP